MSGNDRMVEAAEAVAQGMGAGIGRLLTFDPLTEDFNEVGSGGYVLGAKYVYGQRTYRFCKHTENAVVPAAGDVAFHDDSGVRGEVTTDYSENLGDALRPVGVFVNVPDDGSYFFLLTEGPYPTVLANGDGDIVGGTDVIATAADHGPLNAGARTLATGVGIAYGADDAGGIAAPINVNCEANW